MYISPAQYAQTFAEIKRTSLSHSTCKLVIFVACLDIDLLCLARILSHVLKKELVQYQLIPVVGYTDLKAHFQRLDLEVANVILVGCGAMLDLETFFEIDVAQFVRPPDAASAPAEQELTRQVYILDGHRPWNLDNLFGSAMVVCFDDGFVAANMQPQRHAYTTLVEEGEGEGDDGEEADSTEEGNETDADADGETNSTARLRLAAETIEAYYNQGTSVLTATSAIVYSLLTLIGETGIENLWLAIVGTSSLDSQHPHVYDKIQPLLRDEVIRISPSIADGVDADTALLSIDKDYHLFLLRHWTLYDAFFYSSHVNSKLNLWTEDGKKKLHKLFAKMGILLAVAQQNWLYVDIGVKKQLPLIFKRYLPLYGLEGIVREGFTRTYGYMGQLSAMECVESLTALLEADGRVVAGSELVDQERDDQINSLIEQKEKIWVANFWSAWDALNSRGARAKGEGDALKPRGLDSLLGGLEHAKTIQQIIFRTGMSLLERKLVKNLQLFRLCVLNDGSIRDLRMFNNPLILSKLGGWLLENIAEIEFLHPKGGNLKPLVVAGLDVATDTYLVIGMAPRYPRGMNETLKAKLGKADVSLTTQLNTFSVAFQLVANSLGAKVRIDSFDSSVMEIRKDDLAPFLERLTLSGLV